jgi:hypothetical protein
LPFEEVLDARELRDIIEAATPPIPDIQTDNPAIESGALG